MTVNSKIKSVKNLKDPNENWASICEASLTTLKKSMIYLVKAETLPEISLLDMTAVEEFRHRDACRNCQQLGHRSDRSSEPRV